MEIEYTSVRDEVTFDRGGQPSTKKRIEFYIGKHGPFVERFDPGATQDEITQRIRALHSTLLNLPTSM